MPLSMYSQAFCSHRNFAAISPLSFHHLVCPTAVSVSCLSVCLFVCLSLCLSVCLSVCVLYVCMLAVCLSVCLCISCLYSGCLSVCLSFYLSLGLCCCLYNAVFLSVSVCTQLSSVTHIWLSHPSCPACRVSGIRMHNVVSYHDAVR